MSEADLNPSGGERVEPPAAGDGLLGLEVVRIVTHVVYCRGCQRAWHEAEAVLVGALNYSGPELGDECECICSDDDDPYEDWVVDPDPADIPEGAWTR